MLITPSMRSPSIHNMYCLHLKLIIKTINNYLSSHLLYSLYTTYMVHTCCCIDCVYIFVKKSEVIQISICSTYIMHFSDAHHTHRVALFPKKLCERTCQTKAALFECERHLRIYEWKKYASFSSGGIRGRNMWCVCCTMRTIVVYSELCKEVAYVFGKINVAPLSHFSSEKLRTTIKIKQIYIFVFHYY